MISLHVETKNIDNIIIYSIDQAVVNAQFRVIPHLLIDGEVLLDSTCDLLYQWESSPSLQLHNPHLSKTGLNVTALSQG